MCWLTLLLQITDLNAKLVICTSETSDRVQEAIQLSKEKVPGVQALSFGPAVGCLDLVDALRTCVLDSEKAERPVQYTDKELKEKTCLVFWSSGTTGLPKGTAQSPIPKVIFFMSSVINCHPCRHLPHPFWGFQLHGLVDLDV